MTDQGTIGAVLRGELADWRGLGEETLESLTEALAPVEAVAGPTYAERRLGRFDRYVVTRSAAPADVQVWIPGGSAVVALVEWDDPEVADVDALLDRLGDPEEVQHNQRFRTGTLVDELVYAGRGLNLSIATPHADVGVDPPPRGSRQIVHVQLFGAMELDRWRAALGATVPVRPFPLN
ncbi:MAG TPA: HPF/RaiA family ribosome-associated protein [Microlunatus sp.]|nr:HPF/RaiA family ribosome-associated protein [Microlunatus sp.]